MKKRLLDVIFFSEKRKNVLVLLYDGPKDMEAILNSLKTTRQSLLPQMKILREHQLITGSNDIYKLTLIGKLLINSIIPFLSTVNIFDNDIDYWGTHNLDFIPSHLLERICELKDYEIISPPFVDIHKLNDKILKTSPISKSHYGIITYFHPLFLKFVSDMIANNVNVYLIMPQNAIDKIKTEQLSEFEKLLGTDLFHLFVCPDDLNLVGFACNDYYLYMRQLKQNGEFETKYVLCNDEMALKWGKELFDWYLINSAQVTEI
jgi:predicted transcriptional regulator